MAALAARVPGGTCGCTSAWPSFLPWAQACSWAPNVVRCLQAWGLQKPCSGGSVFLSGCGCAAPSRCHELAVLPLGRHGDYERYGAAYATIHRGGSAACCTGVQRYRCPAVYQGWPLNPSRRQPRGPSHSGGETVVSVRTSQGKEIEGDAHSLALMACGAARARNCWDYQGPACDRHLAYRAWCGKPLPKALRAASRPGWGHGCRVVTVPRAAGRVAGTWLPSCKALRLRTLETWDHDANARATWNLRCRAPAPRCNAVHGVEAAGVAGAC